MQIFLLSACQSSKNFSDSKQYLFQGIYSTSNPELSHYIKVVSWNTNFGDKTDEIIKSLTEIDELENADFILLQELNEVNVDVLAQALKYNYVYFPATIHHQNNKYFGNAILSPWPLSEPQRILLPNNLPDYKQDRIAVRAKALVEDFNIIIYSVHLGHFWMLPGRGDSQVDVLVDQVGSEAGAVVVGGDFNSWTPRSIAVMDKLFGEINLHRVSKGAGPTKVIAGVVPLTLDHIFARKLLTSETGVWQQNEISDHAAVWALLSIE